MIENTDLAGLRPSYLCFNKQCTLACLLSKYCNELLYVQSVLVFLLCAVVFSSCSGAKCSITPIHFAKAVTLSGSPTTSSKASCVCTFLYRRCGLFFLACTSKRVKLRTFLALMGGASRGELRYKISDKTPFPSNSLTLSTMLQSLIR